VPLYLIKGKDEGRDAYFLEGVIDSLQRAADYLGEADFPGMFD
jgi:hypothetical protein